MKMLIPRCVVAGIAAMLVLPAQAAPCFARSGATLAPLVELYTSEGCNSCPPADHWLNQAFARGASAATALAFHVDYWDDGGWKDRFSSHAFTERQYRVAIANRASFVYTPQVVVQGRSATRWHALAPRLAALAAEPAAATITLAVTGHGDDRSVEAMAAVAEPAKRAGTRLYVAVTRDGLTTEVRGGENRGATLRHDHVVQALTEGVALDAEGHATLATRIRPPADPRDTTVVAFVQDPARGDVLQTLALPLDSCRR